jgi:hypothetical protein
MYSNSELQGAVQKAFEDASLRDKIVWWMAAHNPEALIEVAKSVDPNPGIDLEREAAIAATSVLKVKVIEHAQADHTSGTDKVKYIKAHRIITGSHLAQAKDWVEENFHQFN